jgi:LAS superfamily LD-carboxypeptidase LdcB
MNYEPGNSSLATSATIDLSQEADPETARQCFQEGLDDYLMQNAGKPGFPTSLSYLYEIR